jgi:hypothetical protein
MTRKQMTDRVQQWFGMQSIDAYDEIPLIQDLLHRGTIDLLARTRCVARCVHLHYHANVDTYTLDKSIMSLVDVENGLSRRARRDQVDATGSAPFDFTLIRSDVLRLVPTPAVDGVTDVWAVLLPLQMQDDDDSPGDEPYGAIPEEYQDAILTYCFWQAADYGDNSGSKKGELYRVQYEGPDGRGGRIAQIRASVNKRGTARSAPRRVRLATTLARQDWIG